MDSIQDRFTDLMRDAGGRIKNPVILSFIVVWLLQNSTVIFILTTSSKNIQQKFGLIHEYLSNRCPSDLFWWPLLISFFSLGVFYLISIAAQTLKVSAKSLGVIVWRIVDKGNYIEKTVSERIKQENKRLQDRDNILADKVETLKASLANKEEEYLKETNELNEEVKDINIQYEDLLATKNTFEQNAIDLQTQVNSLMSERTHLKSDYETLKLDFQRAETNSVQLSSQMENLKRNNDSLKEGIMAEVAKRNLKVTENEKFEQEVAWQKDRINNLERQLMYAELKDTDSKKPPDKSKYTLKLSPDSNNNSMYHLSKQQLKILDKIFDSSKWRISQNSNTEAENFHHNKGIFVFSTYDSQIADVIVEKNIATIVRTIRDYNTKLFTTTLNVNDLENIKGIEYGGNFSDGPINVIYKKIG